MSDLIKAPENHPIQQSESAMMVQMIQRAAADPSVDVEKMERLMQMHERFVDRSAAAAFNSAMVRAQRRIGPVYRSSFNSQTNSGYAKLEDIDKKISPEYTDEGFSLSFGTEDSPLAGHLRVVCDVMHEQGHTKRYHMDLPLDSAGIAGKVNKTGVHAHGSTNSYARRYLTMNIFNVVLTNEDNDGNYEPESEGLAEEWIFNASNAVTADDLSAVWREAGPVFKKAGDLSGYAKLKSFVEKRLEHLKASAKDGEQ